jgi:hypothetical protein
LIAFYILSLAVGQRPDRGMRSEECTIRRQVLTSGDFSTGYQAVGDVLHIMFILIPILIGSLWLEFFHFCPRPTRKSINYPRPNGLSRAGIINYLAQSATKP